MATFAHLLLPTRTVSTTASLTTNDYLVVAGGSTNYTVTLPTAASSTGQTFHIKSTTTYTITIAPPGAELIDGQTTQPINQHDNIAIFSNGTNFLIV